METLEDYLIDSLFLEKMEALEKSTVLVLTSLEKKTIAVLFMEAIEKYVSFKDTDTEKAFYQIYIYGLYTAYKKSLKEEKC